MANFIDNMRLVEGSFARVFDQVKNKDFAIISAFRASYPKAENRARNRRMLASLRAYGLGGMMLKGGWVETQKDGSKIEVVEESFLLVRPDSLAPETFKRLILDSVLTYEQDAAVVGLDGEISLLFPNGAKKYLGKSPKLLSDDIEGAFSRLRGYSFKITGHLAPTSWTTALVADAEGINY